jgi:hypothetical protein
VQKMAETAVAETQPEKKSGPVSIETFFQN